VGLRAGLNTEARGKTANNNNNNSIIQKQILIVYMSPEKMEEED
jgi:hypothetical protein